MDVFIQIKRLVIARRVLFTQFCRVRGTHHEQKADSGGAFHAPYETVTRQPTVGSSQASLLYLELIRGFLRLGVRNG